jgi:uncharacterized protein
MLVLRPKSCLSKNIRIIKTKNNYFIYDSLEGNLSKVNYDLIKLIYKIKEDRKTVLSKNKEIKRAIYFLKKNKFLISEDYDSISKLQEKFNTYLSEAKSGKFVSNLRLNLSKSCNCSCTYCYVSKINNIENKSMPFEISKIAIKKFIHMARKNKLKEVSIRFFGGEPTLNTDVLKKSLRYSKFLSKRHNIKLNFILNTNGTIMDKELSRLLSFYKVAVIVSLDGIKKIHDRSRILINKQGTFDLIDKNLDMLIKDKNIIIISTVLTNRSSYKDIKNFIKYLAKKRIKSLGINIMQNYSKKGFIKKDAKEVIDLLIKTIKYSKRKEIKVSGSWNTLFYKLSYPSFSYCGGIGKEFSIEPNGDIYPCSAILMKIGSIANLENTSKSAKYLNLLKRSIPFIKDCRGCEIEGICSGGCAAEAIFTKGNIKYSAPDCYLRKKLIERMIKEDNPALFNS